MSRFLVLLIFLAPQAFAQAGFPSKPIRILVPTTAGGVPDVRQVLETAGIPPVGGTPEQFGEAIRAEVQQMATLVKASGAKVE